MCASLDGACPASHTTLYEWIDGVGINEMSKTGVKGRKKCRYRWMCELPIRDGKDALSIN